MDIPKDIELKNYILV